MLQRKLRPSIARVNVQLDPRHAASKHMVTAPINRTRPSPRKHSPDGAARARKHIRLQLTITYYLLNAVFYLAVLYNVSSVVVTAVEATPQNGISRVTPGRTFVVSSPTPPTPRSTDVDDNDRKEDENAKHLATPVESKCNNNEHVNSYRLLIAHKK